MNAILHLDQQLFLWVQHHCHTAFLDQVMPLLRYKYTWVPLYVLLIGFILYKYRQAGLRIILVAVLSVIVSDVVSSRIAKPAFKRLRPCADPEIAAEFTPTIDCGNRGYSFTSSHAANHFALAFALVLFFKKNRKTLIVLAVLWAGSIAFAQVYVGVHYPLDITFGALLGIGIAFGAHQLIQKYLKGFFSF